MIKMMVARLPGKGGAAVKDLVGPHDEVRGDARVMEVDDAEMRLLRPVAGQLLQLQLQLQLVAVVGLEPRHGVVAWLLALRPQLHLHCITDPIQFYPKQLENKRNNMLYLIYMMRIKRI